MPYGLILNGTLTQMLDDAKYLLSPQDLMAVELVPQLMQAGVGSLKIEGRLKGPEYVGLTTRAYRAAVDSAWEQIAQGVALSEVSPRTLTPSERRDLTQVFSRGQDADNDGLSAGFLLGTQHQSVVIGKSPRHRGLHVGTVRQVSDRGITVELTGPLKRGDGVVFDRGASLNCNDFSVFNRSCCKQVCPRRGRRAAQCLR
jgi:collagenase-like PrtC family protease